MAKGSSVDKLVIKVGEIRSVTGAGRQRIGGFSRNDWHTVWRLDNPPTFSAPQPKFPLFFSRTDMRKRIGDICRKKEQLATEYDQDANTK